MTFSIIRRIEVFDFKTGKQSEEFAILKSGIATHQEADTFRALAEGERVAFVAERERIREFMRGRPFGVRDQLVEELRAHAAMLETMPTPSFDPLLPVNHADSASYHVAEDAPIPWSITLEYGRPTSPVSFAPPPLTLGPGHGG